MDIGSFASVVTSLNAAFGLSKAALEIRDHLKLQVVLAELQEKLNSALSGAASANLVLMEQLQKNRELEQTLAEIADWRAVATRYELADFGSETFAWRLKQEHANGEPVHLACPSCFPKRQIGVLQGGGASSVGQRIMRCSACDKTFYLGTMREAHDYRSGGRSRNSAWPA